MQPDLRNSATVKLAFPIEVDGVAYEAFKIRRSTVRDQIAASRVSDDMGRSVRMMALLTGTADDVIESLDSYDFTVLSKEVQSFLGFSAT